MGLILYRCKKDKSRFLSRRTRFHKFCNFPEISHTHKKTCFALLNAMNYFDSIFHFDYGPIQGPRDREILHCKQFAI